ncbi:MAG TPA: hypothetical protein VLV86_20845 [Vicinamibacterales bacterium]|nr:hypothetical protein [Vicinamibacterales bacterium]
MDSAHTVVAGKLEELCEYSFATALPKPRWVSAVDLLPGSPAVVRDAVISVEGGPILGLWQPGDNPVLAPPHSAFLLPAAARLHLQIHYKKHFDQEQQAVSDRSVIGLYFDTERMPPHAIEAIALSAPSTAPGEPRIFSATVASGGHLLAVRPMLDAPYKELTVDVVKPGGERTPALRLRGPRPQWFRRYWLRTPIDLSPSSRIEVRAIPLDGHADEPKSAARFPLEVALDYVPD